MKADTYYGNSSKVFSNKDTYKVHLRKNWLTSYSIHNITANGSTYSRSFGEEAKATYTIGVIKTSNKTAGAHVRGSGTIIQ